jgi:hypothetical protein
MYDPTQYRISYAGFHSRLKAGYLDRGFSWFSSVSPNRYCYILLHYIEYATVAFISVISNYDILNELSPWCSFFLLCFLVANLVLGFYIVRRSITVFPNARHWTLPWPSWFQSTPSHPVYLRSISLLCSHINWGLRNCFFPSSFPTEILYTFFFSPLRDMCHVRLIHIALIAPVSDGEYKLHCSSSCNFLDPHVFPPLS